MFVVSNHLTGVSAPLFIEAKNYSDNNYRVTAYITLSHKSNFELLVMLMTQQYINYNFSRRSSLHYL